MGVPVSERGEQKLQILNAAVDLAKYTLTICRNEKIFPKSQRWILTQKLVNECLEVYGCVRRANTARLSRKEDAEKTDFDRQQELYRHTQQEEAKCHLNAMLGYIDLAYCLFGIESHRIQHWTELAAHTEVLLCNWIKSDKK